MTSPYRSLRSAQLFLIFLAVPLALLVFLYLPPAAEFQNASATRIVVFHVPLAELTVLWFLISAIYAGRYLWKRQLRDDDASAAAAELGLLCCFLALVTGSIFARMEWGSWWNGDPRETSIFFLLLIYGAYFALRGSVDDPTRRAAFGAVYALIACVVMPFLVFVVPKKFESLHLKPGEAHLSGPYKLVLLVAFVGDLIFLIWIFRIRCAIGQAGLEHGSHQIQDDGVIRPEPRQ